jgi:uncharacterized LabA/DUF88 family protein
MKYAILIDAGFIKRKLGSQTQPLDAAGVCAFLASLRAHEALAAMSLHRVYWYDAPPLESRVALTASDLEPNIHQKGVDMRLGLDIAALTLQAHVDTFVLVAGDSDFVPAMKFARREGAQVFLVTLGHPVRTDMFEHSDLVLNVEGARSPATPEFVPGDAPVLDSQVNQ